MNRIRSYIRLVRPEQWIKNVFVLAPLVFSRELFHSEPLIAAIQAFIGFCFVAGAVYSINDLADVSEDRSHPIKKDRPLASGELKSSDALIAAIVLLVAAGMVTVGLSWKYHLILVSYLLVNLVYSFKLKEIVILDVMLIASGFMLRVLAGAYAIQVPVSSWVVLCN